MRIGLLQCDDVAPELRERHGNYPAMFERLFTSVDPALTFQVWRCWMASCRTMSMRWMPG